MRGNPHAAFDVAGTGNVAWSRCCDTRRRKGETTGNTNIDLNRRASPRPYRERDGRRSVAAWPKRSRPSSTLPDGPLRHIRFRAALVFLFVPVVRLISDLKTAA